MFVFHTFGFAISTLGVREDAADETLAVLFNGFPDAPNVGDVGPLE